jgi:hypothetical protein
MHVEGVTILGAPYLRHVHLPFLSPASISAAPTGRIFLEVDIGYLNENLPSKPKFG